LGVLSEGIAGSSIALPSSLSDREVQSEWN
jgi:hypothetical protein